MTLVINQYRLVAADVKPKMEALTYPLFYNLRCSLWQFWTYVAWGLRPTFIKSAARMSLVNAIAESEYRRRRLFASIVHVSTLFGYSPLTPRMTKRWRWIV